jgi:DNA polymerase (family 10)
MPTKTTAKANFKKTSYNEAIDTAIELQTQLKQICTKTQIAGSIRQRKELIGDIDLVVIPKNLDTFYDDVKQIIEFDYGATKKVFGLFKGRPINLFITTEDSYGACLYQCTGPALYNIHKRKLAKNKGFKLNEYGLFNRDTNEKVAGESEKSIFEALGWNYKEPNERLAPEWILNRYKKS